MTTRVDNILIGPGKVWRADPNTALPDETSVNYGADWPGWTQLGLLMTGSGVQLRHSSTMYDVKADGILLPLKRVPTSREVAFAFTLLEYTPANLQLVFPDNALTETAAANGQRAFADLKVGSGQHNPSFCIGIEAFRQDSNGKKQPVRWRLYEASVEPDGETPFQQGAASMLPIVCHALHNDDEGQVAQLIYVSAPASDES
ncbi:MAG: hypothetical protein OXP73_02055 [Chloroflexota bacterium]|nr:hypothetical protein [Chloroflexota bacterium]